MKRTTMFFMVWVLLFSFAFVNASEFSGDGTHTIKKGDFITIDNGWKIEILTVGLGPYSETVNFRLYDSDGVAYPESPYQRSVQKIEGRKKFGTSERLKVEIEVLEVFGEELARAGVSWVEKENARINIVSIDEALPGAVSGDEEIEEVDKELTYKDGKRVTIKVEEEITLGNGYKFKLDRFDQRFGSPYFSLYDSNGDKIDDGIGVGENVDTSLGSLIHVNNYNTDSSELTIIDGSKVTFGTGWNLFSIYLEDGDGYGTVLESTCNRGTMWAWNNELKDYENFGALQEGAKIPAGKGIWVRIQTQRNTQSDIDCEIIVSGKKSVTTNGIQLKAGWNLIGAPIIAYGEREEFEGGSNFNLLSFDNILGDCRLEKGPWQFLATKYTHTSIVSDILEEHQFSRPFENKLRLNRGYFIKVIDDCTLGDK